MMVLHFKTIKSQNQHKILRSNLLQILSAMFEGSCKHLIFLIVVGRR